MKHRYVAATAGIALALLSLCALAQAGHPPTDPKWPQRFEVQGPESASFGFVVTQPGSITVDVQWQGPPLRVTLEGPARAERIGRGRVVVNYTVTPQDVQRGAFWGIRLALEVPAATRAAGQVTVQHPPLDAALMKAAVMKQRRTVQERDKAPETQSQTLAQARARLDAQYKAHVERMVRTRANEQIALVRASQAIIDQARARTTAAVSARAVPPAAALERQDTIQTQITRDARISQQEALQSSSYAIGAAGSTQAPQQIAPPTISGLSTSQGSPGVPPHVQPTPVTITGSGFFDQKGEVRFIINPGVDRPAQIDWWSDGLIRAYVPDASGVLAFDGFVYVVRAADQVKSAPQPFKFLPVEERRSFTSIGDVQVAAPSTAWPPVLGAHHIVAHSNCDNPFTGYKGNDQFALMTRLHNGWRLEDVFITPVREHRGGLYLAEKRVGDAQPYFNVRWWLDSLFWECSYARYIYTAVIVGPHGVPDGLVVK